MPVKDPDNLNELYPFTREKRELSRKADVPIGTLTLHTQTVTAKFKRECILDCNGDIFAEVRTRKVSEMIVDALNKCCELDLNEKNVEAEVTTKWGMGNDNA